MSLLDLFLDFTHVRLFQEQHNVSEIRSISSLRRHGTGGTYSVGSDNRDSEELLVSGPVDWVISDYVRLCCFRTSSAQSPELR
jgi:hypothetical protein